MRIFWGALALAGVAAGLALPASGAQLFYTDAGPASFQQLGPNQYEIGLSPQQTYLRYNTAADCVGVGVSPCDDSGANGATGALIVNLGALGFDSGRQLRLQQLGDYTLTDPAFAPDPFAADVWLDLGGVFATADTILPTEQASDADPNRIPGAILVPEAVFNDDVVNNPDPNVTPNTYAANLVANIPFDFFIGPDTVITVPTGALYLIIGVPDIFYSDNFDPDGDFAVRVALLPIPEPALAGLFALFAAALIARRRRT
jgi:hypothetical protein